MKLSKARKEKRGERIKFNQPGNKYLLNKGNKNK